MNPFNNHENHRGPQEDNEQITSPTSTISSGYGQTVGTYPIRDEGLPEATAMDTSPEVLTPLEAEYKRNYLEQSSPKYAIIQEDTCKIVVPAEYDASGQYPQTTLNTTTGVPWDAPPPADGQSSSSPLGEEAPLEKTPTICGMRRKIFFIVLIAAVLIIAAIGGGVGGALAAKSKSSNSNNTDAAQTSASSTPTPTPTATASSTSSPSPTPTFLNNQTVPGNTFAFQGFSDFNYQGKASELVRTEGGTDFSFAINSYVWQRNVTACCMSFCTNATAKGSIGFLCTDRDQRKSSEPFKRVFVWCNEKPVKENARCS